MGDCFSQHMNPKGCTASSALMMKETFSDFNITSFASPFAKEYMGSCKIRIKQRNHLNQAVEKARLSAIFSDENCRIVCAGGANSPPAWVLRTSKAPNQLPTAGQPGDTISFEGAVAPPNHPQIGLTVFFIANTSFIRFQAMNPEIFLPKNHKSIGVKTVRISPPVLLRQGP